MGKHVMLVDTFEEHEYPGDINEGDYGFILDAEGELKSIFLPENIPFKAPKNVNKILKLFGIPDVENVDIDQSVH
jgi:hypothetical protein